MVWEPFRIIELKKECFFLKEGSETVRAGSGRSKGQRNGANL